MESGQTILDNYNLLAYSTRSSVMQLVVMSLNEGQRLVADVFRHPVNLIELSHFLRS
jgi:hypothetical protein